MSLSDQYQSLRASSDEYERRVPIQRKPLLRYEECWKRSAILLGSFTSVLFLLLTLVSRYHESSEITLDSLLSHNSSNQTQYLHSNTNQKTSARILGTNLSIVNLSKSDLVLPTDGDGMDGSAFNLGIMRLPYGSRWQYIAVARGPRKRNTGEHILNEKYPAIIASILGFGMNMTRDGRFVPVSKATFLHIRTKVASTCNSRVENSWSGPEDARLYWSDSGTPMITVGIPSTSGRCRGIALIQDARSIWPELAAVLARSPSAKEYIAGVTEMEMMEVIIPDARDVEKNWIPFFPGAKPNASSKLPNFIYTAAPDVKLIPPSTANLDFKQALPHAHYSKFAHNSTCLNKAFPKVKAQDIHGATPFYRLTLCKRGECEANQNNTYFLSLNHILLPDNTKSHHTYSRYFSLHSVASPFESVALGSEFHFAGTDDGDIVYATSLFFQPQSHKAEMVTSMLGPIHGFLDDVVTVGLGLADNQLATIKLSLKEDIVAGMKMCHEYSRRKFARSMPF